MAVLVLGGAGYIGSHCAMALIEKGYDVIVFDNLSTGHLKTIETLKNISQNNFEFVNGDLLNSEELDKTFASGNIDAVIHFAAFSQVGESVKDPAKYYRNNICGTLNLLDAMRKYNVDKIVLAGGVSANSYIRNEFLNLEKEKNIKVYYPELKLCTDNAAMIASAGYYNYLNNKFSDLSLNAIPNLKIGENK